MMKSHTNDEKSYENILIQHIGYVTGKNLIYIKINIVNPLYLTMNKVNGCTEESNGNKWLTLVPSVLEKYEELWTKIKDLYTQAL